MILPQPLPGLVVRYNYLWHSEELNGATHGAKNRPCAIILSSSKTGLVTLVPITHSPPEPGEEHLSIEIPQDICREIGLDDERNFIRLGETNRFVWPGYDLHPLPTDPSRVAYGMLPQDFFEFVLARIIAMVKSQMVRVTKRD